MAASELTTMIIERDRARNPWDSLPSGRPIEDVDEAAVREFVEMGKAAGPSETGRPTRQACSSASACLPRTARSPTPAP